MNLTKRMEVKLLLVARTVADLEGAKLVRMVDVRNAAILMGLDSEYIRSLVGK